MPVVAQCEDSVWPLTSNEVYVLWTETMRDQSCADTIIGIRCVDSVEMQRLNAMYRNHDNPTNVLTFSYNGEHDIAICLSVARTEAHSRDVSLRDYVALLLVHAYLHVCGHDHELSDAEAQETADAEVRILRSSGFEAESL